MSSSEDMYQLGVRDAEHDDLNIFYYQHYYYYRQGYDKTRRYLRRVERFDHLPNRYQVLLVLILVGVGITIGFSFLAINTSGNQTRAATGDDRTLTAVILNVSASITPVQTRPFTNTDVSTEAPLTVTPIPHLHVGGQARVVNMEDAVLRARRDPGINAPVQAEFSEGMLVTIIRGPVEQDGFIWWYLESDNGSGWSAEQGPDGSIWLEPFS